MITNPPKQRNLRGHKPTRPAPRAANTAEHQAALAWRLTQRDRWIIRMLYEHRVLTAHQITTLAFPSFRSGRLRLRELYQWRVLDRFQPFITCGTAPMHYVLAPAGATVLAAEHGLDPKHLGYRHHRALGIAHSLRLAHTIGVNDWFTALIHHAQHHPHSAVTAWWSETRCTRYFGDLTQPDAYGRYHQNHREIEFFLEYDLGTEPLTKLTRKLTGYAALADTTAITTPLLIWLPTHHRETTARHQLHTAWRNLPDREALPIATAAAELLTGAETPPNPAQAVWLPITDRRQGPGDGRRELHELLDHWPHLNTTPAGGTSTDRCHDSRGGPLPPPHPMPPITQPSTRFTRS